MIPLIGYSDRLSVAPGERIEFKVSSALDNPYEARLVRIRCGDPNPDGPGIKEQSLDADFAGSYPSRFQPVFRGSYARVESHPALALTGSFTLSARIWPTLPGKTTQGLIAKWDDKIAAGFALLIDERGTVLRLGDGKGQPVETPVGKPLRARVWYQVWVSWDAATQVVSVGQRPLVAAHGIEDEGVIHQTVVIDPVLESREPLCLAALGGAPVGGHYNGKLEDPLIQNVVTTPGARERLADLAGVEGLVAGFDFSRGISTQCVHDSGPLTLAGELVNVPARAMTGSNWISDEACWRHAPERYGAIYFHDDDLHDCGWETDFAFTIPLDLRSGVYAVRLQAGDQHDNIPFFVRPARGAAQSSACVLLPTFTYTIYANYARGNVDEAFHARNKSWGARPWSPDENPEYGLSTYNRHSDGSGIGFASRLRPNLLLRSGYAAVMDPRGSGLRNFPDDTHLLDWLETKGHDYDIVTDEDLHAEGVDLIAPYNVVMTGSHPEYHTKETLDALESYTEGGGRLMYLGGNGFYWKIGTTPDQPGLLEIRRGESGMRAWAAEPGEYFNALDGGYGGLWRRNGRPPQRLVGVGFAGEGPFWGKAYQRAPGADDPRASFIFEDVVDEVLGDFGFSGGGAAGFEVDRTEPALGTPSHALVLASASGYPEGFMLAMEEWLSEDTTWSGPPPEELLRSDMVYFETTNGGAVFSVGSISFIGSLPHNNYDNNISTIVDNVLSRFRTQ